MITINSVGYDFSNEYNIKNQIFTDDKYYCIQVSSWKTKGKAKKEVEKLKAQGHSAFFTIYKSKHENETWFRVRIRYFDNIEGSIEYLNKIR